LGHNKKVNLLFYRKSRKRNDWKNAKCKTLILPTFENLSIVDKGFVSFAVK
jgi:hypothetical protein